VVSKLKKSFLSKIKALLETQRQEIIQQTTQTIEVDHEGDETDEIQANVLIGIANQLNIRNASKLIQIEKSFLRIEDGSYGKCQDCSNHIPEKRLLVNPHFQTCVDCAEDRELEAKRKKQ
jgi:RNA polymerase-binding transcription factor